MSVNHLRSALPPLSAAFLAALVLGVTLHRGWIMTEFWLLALPLFAMVLLVTIALLTVALWQAGRSTQRWALPVTALFAVLGVFGSLYIFFINPKAGVWARFWLERPAFDAVAKVEVPLARKDNYYGVDLPSHLCFVSANCKVVSLGTSGGQPIRFVPDSLGIPDGAVGYAHFAAEPATGYYDGFGDAICPTMKLADGWWWLGNCRPTGDGPFLGGN